MTRGERFALGVVLLLFGGYVYGLNGFLGFGLILLGLFFIISSKSDED